MAEKPLFTKLTLKAEATIGTATLEYGGRVLVGSGQKLVERMNDFRSVIRQLVLAFEAERTALGATADHAGGIIDDGALIAAIDEAARIRGQVPPEMRARFAEIIVAEAGSLCDGETLAALLGTEIDEGSNLLEEAMGRLHG